MQIHDISAGISPTIPVYPGDPPVKITSRSFPHSDYTLTLSHLDMGAHTGTHVDAPLHFLKGGRTIDQLELTALVGPAQVVDFTHVDGAIHAHDFEKANMPRGFERILCKTRNSALWDKPGFQTNFVAFAWDAADWMVEHHVKLVGIDYLSVEMYGVEPRSHLRLLDAGVIIVEGLNLREVSAGEYTLVCLPLLLRDVEGAPARAILIEAKEIDRAV